MDNNLGKEALDSRANGSTSTRRQSNISLSSDDPISHVDAGVSAQGVYERRPLSQGAVSASAISGHSRPNTSSGGTSGILAMTPTTPQMRPGSTGTDVGGAPTMRHGFAEAYSSEEYLTMLEQVSLVFVCS